jgi:hypothetical protein
VSQVRIRGIEDVNRVLQEIAPREAINLMRATTAELAKGLAQDAKANAPIDQGNIKGGIRHRRARGTRTTVKAEVVANANRTSFYWRYREYGQGPDGQEDAFFLRALMRAQSEIGQRYLAAFTDKLLRRLARKNRG